jgi:hypothetical protein
VTGVRPDGTVYYDMKCKIGQVGKIFFARARLYEYGPAGLNIRLLLSEAQRPRASVHETVERFETLYADAYENIKERSERGPHGLQQILFKRARLRVPFRV